MLRIERGGPWHSVFTKLIISNKHLSTMKIKTKTFISILFFMIYMLPAVASPNGPEPGDDESAPIDGYSIILILIAIVIGGYVFLSHKLKPKEF